MAREDVERFVGLLVSDEDFVADVRKDFRAAVATRGIRLDRREAAVLKEGIDVYVNPRSTRIIAGRDVGTAAVPAAVGAAVAGAVPAEVATKVVDKLFSAELVTPVNERLREVIIARGTLTRGDFNIG
jgi:hypothetical protein